MVGFLRHGVACPFWTVMIVALLVPSSVGSVGHHASTNPAPGGHVPTASEQDVIPRYLGTDPFGLADGDLVEVVASTLNCRTSPSSNATIVSTESYGEEGTIANGSVSSNGYIWWEVTYKDSHTGWSVEGTGSTDWLQNITGGAVAYNRTAAMSYAQQYWSVVTSDGYFWNSSGTYVQLAQGTSVVGMTGDDCAHFVSQAIGDEPHHPGGGLNIPTRVPPTYGEPGNAALGDLLINNGWATVVSSVGQLTAGDVINYEWTSGKGWQHVAFYLGNGTVAAHTNSHYGANWTLGGAYAYRFIHILASPTGGSSPLAVSLKVTPSVGVAPQSVTATADAAGGSGSYSSFVFKWGDGSLNTTTASNASAHTFQTAGLFAVQVSVHDSSGALSSSGLVTVNVSLPLTATLTSSSIAGLAPVNITFNASGRGGSGNYVRFIWSFGDNGTATTSTGVTAHTYLVAGTFKAHCTLFDSTGRSAMTNVVNLSIGAQGGGNNPMVKVAVSPLRGSVPLLITANVTATGGSGTFPSYVFHWGDGTPDTTTSAQVSTHTFFTGGLFIVGASATDSSGRTGWSQNVTVNVSGNAVENLTASIVASADSGDVPFPVSFVANVAGGTGVYSSFEWTFGDGYSAATSTRSTMHTYSKVGTFGAGVVITDSHGTIGHSPTVGIVVSGTLVPSLSATSVTGSAPFSTTLTLTISGGQAPFILTFDFGDNESLGSQTVSGSSFSRMHVYQSAGVFDVKGTVEDSNSDWGNVTVSIQVSSQGSASAPSIPLFALSSPYALPAILVAIALTFVLFSIRRRKRLREAEEPLFPPSRQG